MKIGATARVRLEIEYVAGSWGADCPLEQVYRQAARDAVEKLEAMAGKAGFRVVGTPRVTAILVEKED
jgi:predicted Zn-dependent protease